MSDPSTEPLPDPLKAIDAEWKLRDAVNRAHAAFHVKPSPASADGLQRALTAWRGDAGIEPIITALSAELQRQADASGGYIWVGAQKDVSVIGVDGDIELAALAAAVAKVTGGATHG